jgi:hypothetical protein
MKLKTGQWPILLKKIHSTVRDECTQDFGGNARINATRKI